MADEVSLRIEAPAGELYGLVSDVTNMGRWSPETKRAGWVGGATGPAVGAQFKGWNKRGPIRWSTKCTVTKADPGREFQFEVKQNGMRWGYRFEPAGDGTLVTEFREDVHGRPFVARAFTKLFLGPDHEAEMVDGMRQTLERIKAAAEA
jgi:hypothetical protein